MILVIHQIVTLIIVTSRLAIITVVVLTPSSMHVGKNAVREEHGQEEV
jgi:hypothetical protein